MTEAADPKEFAENLRLQGNDAFSTKDWERAMKLYWSSVAHAESAKAYSNLAATLCKLGRFAEANEAAERATTLEPAWAKGWWRRGVIAEMHKLFSRAYQFYSIAVDLEPDEKTFRKAAKSVEKRLKISKIETADGKKISVGDGMLGDICDAETAQKIPGTVAWTRFCAGNPEHSLEVYLDRQENFPTGTSPTSEQWLNQGLYDWSNGLRDGAAALAVATVPHARDLFHQEILGRGLDGAAMRDASRQLLGGEPYKTAIQELSVAFSHLGGVHVGLKIEGGIDDDDHWFCSRPPFLTLPAYQPVSLLLSIHGCVREMLGVFGNKAKMSKFVLNASEAFCANLRQPKPTGGEAASPKEVVAYLAQQIRAGHTWNGGVRKYVSLLYRGTILAGALSRLFGRVAECYEHEKWAREFLTIADLEFKVNEERSYGEKGTAFLPSFQIGMMVSELRSLSVLHGDKLDGPYSVESLVLAFNIIKMANKMEVPRTAGHPEYCYVQNDVGCRRKPLALAHSTLAANLTTFGARLRPEDFDRMAIHVGLKNEGDDQRDKFAIIAEHYRLAAEAELPDAQDTAIYWWAYASNMTKAGSVRGDGNVSRGPYTLGELRTAIATAEDAELARDVGLFGVNKQRGGSHESIAKITAHQFRTNPDSFILRQVTVAWDGSVRSLKIGNDVICPDLGEYERKDIESRKDQHNRYSDLYDTSEIDKDHGRAVIEGLPSLETLCIRELHKQQCEFAVGETDAGVIQYKAMVAAQERNSTKE